MLRRICPHSVPTTARPLHYRTGGSTNLSDGRGMNMDRESILKGIWITVVALSFLTVPAALAKAAVLFPAL